LGHSLGESDHDILNYIFTSRNVKEIYVFYYENQNNFLSNHSNYTRRIEANREFQKNFKSFETTIKMPQKNISNKETDIAIQKLSRIFSC
jgi:uncharacterized protein YfaA (DUF2138 family)